MFFSIEVLVSSVTHW